MPLIYLVWSIRYGKKAPANPWQATGLEWQTPSPPPHDNFEITPIVTHEPYEYSAVEAEKEREQQEEAYV
jgi:cytochrome c oxidase subunit 1